MRQLGITLGIYALLLVAGAQGSLQERVQLSGTLRLQWSDTQGASGSDGFNIRLMRFSTRFQVDEQTTGNLQVEFASGDGGYTAELLDAFLTWRPNPQITVYAGQMLAPLYYDIRERITVLETLERGNTTRTLFRGARLRGSYVAYRVNPQNTLEAGLWNSLTYRDPQLEARGGQAAVAGTLSWRYSNGDTQLTLGGLVGTRPRLQGRDAQNNPIEISKTERRLFYAEIEQHLPRTPLTIRADYLWGRDRNPAGGTTPRFLTPSDFETLFLYAVYDLTSRQQLVLAWEDFDPDTRRAGDRLRTLSLTYHYFARERVRLSARYEWNTEERGNRTPNDRVIFAAQYRF
ncbi:MAG: hypothetical protein ACUVV1_00525 [Fimbriimonadales bacterium]